MDNNEKLILRIAFNEETGNYSLTAGKGMSVNELMFGVSALIRCLVRDKIVDDKNIPVEMLNRYLNDSQYDELKQEEENEGV